MNGPSSIHFFAIPYFKDAYYLHETLHSLVGQSDPHWQAVVLDDSVSQKEESEARKCVEALADSRILYQKNTNNLGLALNWNQGLNLGSEFELCSILHADDRLTPDYIKEIRKLAEKYPHASAYFARAEIIGEESEKVFSVADAYKKLLLPKEKEIVLKGIHGIEKLIPGNFIFCPSLTYRMSKVHPERFSAHFKMVVDFEFILRLLKRGGELVGFYHHPLFQYRRHSQNTTISLTENHVRFHEEIALYRELAEHLKLQGHSLIAKRAEALRVIKLNLAFQIVKSLARFKLSEASGFSRLLFSL